MEYLHVHESGTAESPLIYDGGNYPKGIWVTGDYVHVLNINVGDGTGPGYGAGLSIEGNHCRFENIEIGRRWRGVDIRNGASNNHLSNINVTRSPDAFYISGPQCNYNHIVDCSAYRTAEGFPDADGHGVGITDSDNNTIINFISRENQGLNADIIAFRSLNTVFSKCESFKSKCNHPILVTIRSDGTVIDRCISDGVIDIAGTPNVRVLNSTGEITVREAGPDNDTTGLVIIP